MPRCVNCGKPLHCTCTPTPQKPGLNVLPCGIKQGALWVRVTDDEGTDLNGATVTAAKAAKKTAAGMAVYDPLDPDDYEVVFNSLNDTDTPLHGPPEHPSETVNVSVGQITLVAFEVPRKAMLKVKVSKKIDPTKAAKRQVAAKTGDCLCGIAAEVSLLNCDLLRGLAENAELVKRELKAGDSVTLPPDPEKLFEGAKVTIDGPEKPEPIDTADTGIADFGRLKPGEYTIKVVLKEADAKYFSAPAEFKVTLAPAEDHTAPVEVEPLPIGPLKVRFVRGSQAQPARDDAAVDTLHVSNFVTDKGGLTGQTAFPKGYGYSADGDADPDTFKVEVWDPIVGGAINANLNALKPVYGADDGSGKLKPASYTPFVGDGRVIDTPIAKCTTHADTYRSKYMRLVVDEADRDSAGLPGQLLYVSDLADGLGTGLPADNDAVEILDQKVRAIYTVSRCAAASDKCKVTTEVDIGGGERQRVRVRFTAHRQTAGADTMPTGVTSAVMKQHLRRRIFKWYRRSFAQANVAPLLKSLDIVDPPAENMLCLSHKNGKSITAVNPDSNFDLFLSSIRKTLTGNATGHKLEFRIKTATRDIPVSVGFDGGETPVQAGAAIVGKIPPGFTGTAHVSSRSTNAINASADVIIEAADGERVTLLDVTLSPGAGMTVDVPRVDMMNVLNGDAEMDSSTSFLTADTKRILRATQVTDDAMYCIVVGQFSTPSLRGQAYLPCLGAGAEFQPGLPFRASTIMAYQSTSGPVLDGGDNLPFTSPHENVHTLCDLIHTKPQTPHHRTELMASGTSAANSVSATKRICDGPYTVQMQKNGTTTQTTQHVRMVQVMRTGGADKLETW